MISHLWETVGVSNVLDQEVSQSATALANLKGELKGIEDVNAPLTFQKQVSGLKKLQNEARRLGTEYTALAKTLRFEGDISGDPARLLGINQAIEEVRSLATTDLPALAQSLSETLGRPVAVDVMSVGQALADLRMNTDAARQAFDEWTASLDQTNVDKALRSAASTLRETRLEMEGLNPLM